MDRKRQTWSAQAVTGSTFHLWVLEGCPPEVAVAIAQLPWLRIWQSSPKVSMKSLLRDLAPQRRVLEISENTDRIPRHSPAEHVPLLTLSKSADARIKPNSSARILEALDSALLRHIATATGDLVLASADPEAIEREAAYARHLAPHLRISSLLVTNDTNLPPAGASADLLFSRTDDLINHIAATVERRLTPHRIIARHKGNLIDIELPRNVHDRVMASWDVMYSHLLEEQDVTQEAFDSFLRGNNNWAVANAGAIFPRLHNFQKLGQRSTPTGLDHYVIELAKALEEGREGRDQSILQRVLIFAEPSSGATTQLRYLALLLARAGLPTIIQRPDAVDVNIKEIEVTVSEIRRLLNSSANEPTSCPIVVIQDSTGEKFEQLNRLARNLAELSTPIIYIKSLERSREEIHDLKPSIDHARFILNPDMSDKDVSEFGNHLRRFAAKHSLETLPSEDEWLELSGRLSNESAIIPRRLAGQLLTPSNLLFVALYPFVKERIKDVNSLGQYYYQRWAALEQEAIRDVVLTLAAAGGLGLSVPYDTMLRHNFDGMQALLALQRDRKRSDHRRSIDLLLSWLQDASDVAELSLGIRHPVIGRLLCEMALPEERAFPASLLLPLLSDLTNRQVDINFAESVVFLATRFRRARSDFALEFETAHQRRARLIFEAIPELVKMSSATILHHEARYHSNIVRACVEALKDRSGTQISISDDDVRSIAEVHSEIAGRLIAQAISVEHGESPTIIYNTKGTVLFRHASTLKSNSHFNAKIQEGLAALESAVALDPANYTALFQSVQRGLDAFEDRPDAFGPQDRLRILGNAEYCLNSLHGLLRDGRWRNYIDEEERGKKIEVGSLTQRFLAAIKAVPDFEHSISDFQSKDPETSAILDVRRICGRSRVPDAFKHPEKAEGLRAAVDVLGGLGRRSARGQEYYYRLIVADPASRLDFPRRLKILGEMKRLAGAAYLPYRHDEAALLSDLGELPAAAGLFAEIRRQRFSFGESNWFWHNERALVDSQGRPVQFSFEIKSVEERRVVFYEHRVAAFFQPSHFPMARDGEIISGYVRFTLNGFQVVSEQLISSDLRLMGLR